MTISQFQKIWKIFIIICIRNNCVHNISLFDLCPVEQPSHEQQSAQSAKVLSARAGLWPRELPVTRLGDVADGVDTLLSPFQSPLDSIMEKNNQEKVSRQLILSDFLLLGIIRRNSFLSLLTRYFISVKVTPDTRLLSYRLGLARRVSTTKIQ